MSVLLIKTKGSRIEGFEGWNGSILLNPEWSFGLPVRMFQVRQGKLVPLK